MYIQRNVRKKYKGLYAIGPFLLSFLEIFTRFKDGIEIAIETLEKGSKVVEYKIVIDGINKELD